MLAVLAYLVRGNTDLVRLDESVATWGDRHASAFSTDGLNAVTHLGEPVVVAGLAAILAVVETGGRGVCGSCPSCSLSSPGTAS